jgi:hypothetical protein
MTEYASGVAARRRRPGRRSRSEMLIPIGNVLHQLLHHAELILVSLGELGT